MGTTTGTAWEYSKKVLPGTSNEDLSNDQFRFVVYDTTAQQYRRPNSITEASAGVLQDAPGAADREAGIAFFGFCKVLLGGTVAAGDLVGAEYIDADDAGKAIVITPDLDQVRIRGRAMHGGVEGDLITIELINSGGLDSGLATKYASVTLTSLEVKALAASPATLVAAQGANTLIELVSLQMLMTYGGTNQFTANAGDDLEVKYTDDSGVIVSQTIETLTFLTPAASTIINGLPKVEAIVASASALNQPLVLDNIGVEIAGNAANDNTLTIKVAYRVHDFS